MVSPAIAHGSALVVMCIRLLLRVLSHTATPTEHQIAISIHFFLFYAILSQLVGHSTGIWESARLGDVERLKGRTTSLLSSPAMVAQEER